MRRLPGPGERNHTVKKKLVLISPHPPGNVGEENVSVLNQMPVNLAYLKALTHDGWEVDIIDETQEPAITADGADICFGGADLVGITAMTHQAPRAYEIAQACRARGIPVVMGGVHVTAYPQEAMQFADAISKREGFTVWPRIIADFEANNLQREYDGGLNQLGELHGIWPDREFLRQKYGYRYTATVATAGCPYNCDFCFVPLFQGHKYRERPVEDILDELESFKGKYRGMIWTDENFYGHSRISHERALRLYRGMAERNINQNWFGFTSIHIHEDDEVLYWMAQSGSVGMLIGFESIDLATLKSMNKNFNAKIEKTVGYRAAIERIRKHGLAVWATMIFGSDTDTPDTFDRVADFVLDNEIDIMTNGLATPFPGTRLYDRLMAEGRVFRNNYPWDWKYYTAHHLLYTLKSMTLDQLIESYEHLYDRLYTTEMLRKRFARSRAALQNMNSAVFAFRVNLDWQGVYRHIIENLKALRDSGDYERALKGRVSVSVPGSSDAVAV